MTNATISKSVQLITEISNKGGKITTTSQQIAGHFNKRHDNVIKAIRNLECSEAFRLLNFEETVETRLNPSGGAPISSPAYRITRNGFSFLAMGFTGKEAAAWKEAYIEAFDQMADKLSSNSTQPALDATISSEQQGILYNEVCRQNPDGKKRHAAWHRFGSHFNINSYKNLPASRFEEAKVYLGMKSGFQAVKAAPQAMGFDAARVAAYPAIGLASATAAKVFDVVLQEVLANAAPSDRYMLAMERDDGQYTSLRFKPIPHDACIMPPKKWASALREPGALALMSDDRTDIAKAVIDKHESLCDEAQLLQIAHDAYAALHRVSKLRADMTQRKLVQIAG